jgi:hypothetical protein
MLQKKVPLYPSQQHAEVPQYAVPRRFHQTRRTNVRQLSAIAKFARAGSLTASLATTGITASLAAVFDILPVASPLLSPREGPLTMLADLLREMRFLVRHFDRLFVGQFGSIRSRRKLQRYDRDTIIAIRRKSLLAERTDTDTDQPNSK